MFHWNLLCLFARQRQAHLALARDRQNLNRKGKVGDTENEERKKSEAGFVQATDKILISHCVEAYRQKGFRPAKPRNKKDVKPLKPAASSYYEQRIVALKESWPDFENLEVRRVTEKQCADWAVKYSPKIRPMVKLRKSHWNEEKNSDKRTNAQAAQRGV